MVKTSKPKTKPFQVGKPAWRWDNACREWYEVEVIDKISEKLFVVDDNGRTPTVWARQLRHENPNPKLKVVIPHDAVKSPHTKCKKAYVKIARFGPLIKLTCSKCKRRLSIGAVQKMGGLPDK